MSAAWVLFLWVINPDTGLGDWVPLGDPVESRERCLALGQQVLPLMRKQQGFIAKRYMCHDGPLK